MAIVPTTTRPMKWHLKDWRKNRGITQDKLAELVGTNKGQISKLETGMRDWDREWVTFLSNALGLKREIDIFTHPDAIESDGLLSALSPKSQNAVLVVIAALRASEGKSSEQPGQKPFN